MPYYPSNNATQHPVLLQGRQWWFQNQNCCNGIIVCYNNFKKELSLASFYFWLCRD
jgi:hypothetical protein